MEMISTIRKVNEHSSIGITIDKNYNEVLNLKPGDKIIWKVVKKISKRGKK